MFTPHQGTYFAHWLTQTECQQLAEGIMHNAKGDALLVLLEKAMDMTESLGGQRKAVVFTESCRTQRYLNEFLETKGYNTVLLNGASNDARSKAIYRDWFEKHQGSARISGSKVADMKAALKVREEATRQIYDNRLSDGQYGALQPYIGQSGRLQVINIGFSYNRGKTRENQLVVLARRRSKPGSSMNGLHPSSVKGDPWQNSSSTSILSRNPASWSAGPRTSARL